MARRHILNDLLENGLDIEKPYTAIKKNGHINPADVFHAKDEPKLEAPVLKNGLVEIIEVVEVVEPVIETVTVDNEVALIETAAVDTTEETKPVEVVLVETPVIIDTATEAKSVEKRGRFRKRA